MRDGWRIVKLREAASRTTKKNLENLDLVFTVSAIKGLIRQEDYFTRRVASKNLRGYYVIQPGEYVFNKSYSKDAPYGVIARNLQHEAGVVSPIYIGFIANELMVHQDFLGLALSSQIFWESLRENLKEGGRGHGALNLGVEDFFDSLVPLPPLSDQKRIVDLISSVDVYIEALQNQLESAKKSRNALLYGLLTSGGTDWPEVALSAITRLITDGSHFSPKTSDSGVPYVTVRDLKDGFIDLENAARISEASFLELEKNGCRPIAGDLLFSKDGTVGKVALVETDDRFVVLSSLAILRPKENEILPKFLALAMGSENFQREAIGSKTGLAIKRIVLKHLKSLTILVPPIAVQKSIVDEVAVFDSHLGALTVAIDSGKRMRGSLLDNLLSGKQEIPATYDIVMGIAS